MASKGFFIVLEGIDGCGKSTIAKLLAKKLNVWSTKEPTPGLQKRIEAARSKLSVLDMQKLYIADRIAHTNKIKAALVKGKTVICQRYALSTFAYGTAFGVSQKDLQHDFLTPDITFLLDLPAQEAMKRITMRKETKEFFEKKEKLEKIRKAYLKLAKSHHALIIDARATPDVLIKELTDVISRRIIEEK